MHNPLRLAGHPAPYVITGVTYQIEPRPAYVGGYASCRSGYTPLSGGVWITNSNQTTDTNAALIDSYATASAYGSGALGTLIHVIACCIYAGTT